MASEPENAPDVEALAEAGDVRGLIEALANGKSSVVRKAAAEALGGEFDFLGQVGLGALAMKMVGLQNVEPSGRRQWIVDAMTNALLKKPPQEALVALVAALTDEDAGVRASSAEAIGRIWYKPWAMKWEFDRMGRFVPADQFASVEQVVIASRSGPSCLQALAGRLEDVDEQVRRATIEALKATLESAAVTALCTASEADPILEIREAAKEAAEEIEVVLMTRRLPSRF